MKLLKCFYLFLVLVVGCQAKKNDRGGGMPVYDLKKLTKTTQVSLSELGFIDVLYIPLETVNEGIINKINEIKCDNASFILHYYNDILKFDANGLLKCRIGKEGRGPGEFITAHEIDFDEITHKIYLVDGWIKRFFVYSGDGKLLRTFNSPFNTTKFILIGDSIKRPKCWYDMQRHLHFGLICDLWSIKQSDWPDIKNFIYTAIYAEDEPIPVQVKDLDDIVSTKPSGRVTTKLAWEKITAEDFERLIYCLISSEASYENPEWLLKTTAPDRGRDLSAYRVNVDNLSGVTRKRVIFQCKHWLSKSINLSDIAMVKEEIKLWEPPRIDVLVIATSGRFTSDAVAYIEKNNQSDTALMIEMWPESHFERLIAMRPYLIAEFGLR